MSADVMASLLYIVHSSLPYLLSVGSWQFVTRIPETMTMWRWYSLWRWFVTMVCDAGIPVAEHIYIVVGNHSQSYNTNRAFQTE